MRLLACIGLACLALPSGSHAAWPSDPATNLPVCTATGNQLSPRIAPDGAGGAILAWYDNRTGSADVYAHRLRASGVVDPAWPANGLVVCAATGNQTAPWIVSDAAGGAIIVWQDSRNAAGADIYAHRVLNNGVVDPAWPANGLVVCAATGVQSAPVCIGDGDGGAIVVWQDQRSGTTDDLYAQHVLPSGAVDPGWPADGQALCVAAGVQQRPRAVGDGNGGAIVAWYDQRGGAGTDDVYAQRILSTGIPDPAWPANGLALCSAAGAQQFPAIAGDGAGGAIVAWYDERSGATSADIHAQHVLIGGAVDPAWPADGLPVCTAAGKQQFPAIVGDGDHGALVAWQDARSGTSDIYANRVLAGGSKDPSWPATDVAVCSAVNTQSSLVMEPDGGGGALLGWVDFRANASVSDVFAHHLMATGTTDPAWPQDGVQICSASGSQVSPALLPDGAGGAILGWADQRLGATNVNIYAQRVQANGQLGGAVVGVSPEIARPLTLGPARPNPCRAGECALEITLGGQAGARLEVFDLNGRRLLERDLSALGPGLHRLEFGRTWRRAPGVYLVRLVQGEDRRTARVVVLD